MRTSTLVQHSQSDWFKSTDLLTRKQGWTCVWGLWKRAIMYVCFLFIPEINWHSSQQWRYLWQLYIQLAQVIPPSKEYREHQLIHRCCTWVILFSFEWEQSSFVLWSETKWVGMYHLNTIDWNAHNTSEIKIVGSAKRNNQFMYHPSPDHDLFIAPPLVSLRAPVGMKTKLDFLSTPRPGLAYTLTGPITRVTVEFEFHTL